MRRIFSLPLALVTLLLALGSALALESRSFMEHTEDGSLLVTESREGESSPTVFTTRDDVLWHRNQANIFYSTAIGNNSGVISGDWLGIDMHYLYGDGTPMWSSSTGDTEAVGAAKNADLFAAATVNAAISGFTLRAFNQSSSTPIWIQDIPDAYLPNLFVRISDDGSRVVMAMKMVGVTSRVNTYDGLTGALVSTYHVASPATVPRAMEISDDGSLAALRASAYIHVIETETGTLRWTGSAGASADGFAFSGDGNWVAAGWTSLLVYHWNGSTYDLAWSHNGGSSSWYLTSCGFSADGGDFIAGFNNSNYTQLRVMWWDPVDSTPDWTYDSPISNGVYQERFSGCDMAASGNFAVMGSWGDQAGLNPEIHVFWPGGADPIFTVDSPGSIYTVACRDDDEGGGIVACGAGKNVHANEYGNGGDIYAMEVMMPTEAPEHTPVVDLHLSAYPNPFNPQVTLSAEMSVEGSLSIEIFSPDGRLIREVVSGFFPAGNRQFQWDGKNAAGQELPSGVYLARAKSAGGEAFERLVLLR